MMTATERRKEAAGRVRAAEDAVARLRAGLAGVGVKLPSLRVDPVSCAGNEPSAAGRPRPVLDRDGACG